MERPRVCNSARPHSSVFGMFRLATAPTPRVDEVAAPARIWNLGLGGRESPFAIHPDGTAKLVASRRPCRTGLRYRVRCKCGRTLVARHPSPYKTRDVGFPIARLGAQSTGARARMEWRRCPRGGAICVVRLTLDHALSEVEGRQWIKTRWRRTGWRRPGPELER